MSDSDSNDRNALPWWLKPLGGGKKEEVDPAADEPAIDDASDRGPVAEEAAEESVSGERDAEDRGAEDQSRDRAPWESAGDDVAAPAAAPESTENPAKSWSDRWDEPAESPLEAGSSTAPDRDEFWGPGGATDPPAEVHQPGRTDAAATDAAEDSADAREPAAPPPGADPEEGPAKKSRGRRRGRRGGRKKKNGTTGGKSAEPERFDVTPRVPEAAEAIELLVPPERTLSVNDERKLGVFCDFENIVLGVRDSEIKRFDIHIVLERLLEKGKIIVKKAYADWERYSDYKRTFHEAAIELIDIPQKYYSGKNSADIKMVVDAMELSYTRDHLDTFVVMSGDSDFSPLVSKLKENNKAVIGVGVKNSSSNLLVDNCDEFIYYEDIWRETKKAPTVSSGSKNKKSTEAFNLLVTSIKALMRDNKDVLWGSMIKQTMQRKKPSFNEGYYGYSTFSELLEDAERQKLVKLKRDQRSGTYIVTGFAGGR